MRYDDLKSVARAYGFALETAGIGTIGKVDSWTCILHPVNEWAMHGGNEERYGGQSVLEFASMLHQLGVEVIDDKLLLKVAQRNLW